VPILALIGLAAVLDSTRLGTKSLFLDEAVSFALARSPLSGLFHTLVGGEANQGLYYLILHFWLLFGHGETWMRLLSVIPAVATVPVIWKLTDGLFGSRQATLASLLLVLSGFFVSFAQEARGYSLVVFLITASMYLFVQAVRKPSALRWVGYVLISTLAIYTHFFAAIVLLAQALSLPFLRGQRVRRKDIFWSFASIAALSSPLALFVMTENKGQLSWLHRPSLSALVEAARQLAGGRLLLLVFAAAVIAALVWAFDEWRGGRLTSGAGWSLALVLSWLATPVLVSFSVSLVIQPVFHPRYLVVSLPALIILVSVGVFGLRWQWMRVLLVIALVGLSAHGVFVRLAVQSQEDWRGATGLVVQRAKSGDEIMFLAPYVITPFSYYVETSPLAERVLAPLYPSIPWNQFGKGCCAGIPPGTMSMLLHPSPDERLWLILSHEQSTPGDSLTTALAQKAIRGAWTVQMTFRFRGIQIELLRATR
jgi:uncharacterized membrane protein